MKSLFDEYDPKVARGTCLTPEYKIRFIFEKLIHHLEPEIIDIKKTKRYNAMGIRGKEVILKNYISHCSFENKYFELPFDDVTVIVTKKRILIKGSNFQYQFPPMMIMEIWERIKQGFV